MSAPSETVRRTAIGRDGESPARTTPTTERKLAAILSADVKGYSRLMGVDEVGTLRTLTTYRKVMATLIEQRRGRVVNSVGDNLLAEFASVVDAVQCAEEIQHTLQKKNARLPRHRHMEFRIGINVGDVLVEGDQLYGDGVNIAARLEQLAEAGGICISGTVYDQIENKLALPYEYLGEQTVKNIAQPVRVYRVQMEPEAKSEISRGSQEQLLFFPPFHLDVVNACLWHGKKRISLTPKDFAVLHHLAAHSQQLVTHEELLKAVWSDVKVSPGVLKVCLRRIRQALGDSSTKPRFIETKHRQGYRFIAPITTPTQPVSGFKFQLEFQVSSSKSEPTPDPRPLIPNVVGREAELRQLHVLLEKALQGERQIVFVAGEPGIGKTTIVSAFLERVAATGEVAIGRGQCIEHYGSGEAYLPVLEALGRLCRAPGGDRVVEGMKQHAPTWLVQMPALLSTSDLEALQRKVQGATRERMLRELSEGIEVLTEQWPFVLVLEDLHWSDVSTLDLIAALARRQERARLLVIGTYRPVEMLSKEHPLNEVMQELRAHHLGAELALGLLSEAHVAEYLRTRFPLNALPASFARALHQRTEGNPLFLVNVVDDLVAQEVIAQGEEGWTLQGDITAIAGQVPESVRHLIAKQSKRLLPTEQQILQAASVAGMEFSTAVVAAALKADVEEVEEWCSGLAARRHFLRRIGIGQWPDGTVGERYGFLHALYQHLWHERVPMQRRQRFHLHIGERLEEAYRTRSNEVATELAVHFEEARDLQRALRYRHQAAMNALGRSTYHEAARHLTRGLNLLQDLSHSPERDQHELTFQTALGPTLLAIHGWASSAAGAAYHRARELCQQQGESPQLFVVMFGQWAFHLVRGEHQIACDLSTQLLHLAQNLQDPSLLLEAHWTSGCSAFFLGEFHTARAHFEQGLSLYNPQQHHTLAFLYGQDPAVSCLCYLALTLWCLGYPDQTQQQRQETLARARSLNHPFSLAWALGHVPVLHFLRQEEDLRLELINEGITLSTEHGFAHPLRTLSLMRHCVLIAPKDGKEGIACLREQLATYRAAGVDLYVPMILGSIAEGCNTVGHPEEGIETVSEALALLQKTNERYAESELHRLKGELMLQAHLSYRRSKSRAITHLETEAEACFLQAIDVAQRQGAKMCELRAAMSLGRLWQRQGKRTIARQRLVEIYDWFTEGFETAELKQAKALLEELA